MFNLSGSEIVFLLLIALIVLGPEALPDAVRKFGKVYGELKKMGSGFQTELKSALDEPMREMRETAEAFKKAANLNFDSFTTAEVVEPEATGSDVVQPEVVQPEVVQPEVVQQEVVQQEVVQPDVVQPDVDESSVVNSADSNVEPAAPQTPTTPEVGESVQEPAAE